MVEFTEEQKEEVQKQLALRDFAIAGDRATRLMVIAANQSVQTGADDGYVLKVAQVIRQQFMESYFPPAKTEPAKDDSVKE